MASASPDARSGSVAWPRLAVVIPMYNEQDGAAACVREVSSVLSTAPGDGQLIVVNDGSADQTRPVLVDLLAQHSCLSVAHHEQNSGYGAALRTGAELAAEQRRPWVLFMDSDLTNPPSDILRFWPLLTEQVDLVKASRYASGGSQHAVPLRRRAVSVAGNTFARLASGLPLTDLTNGFRAVRTETFLRMPLTERGFAVILEEVYWASRLNLRCAELPTTLGTRDARLRPSSFAYTPKVLWAYGRYPLRLVGHRARRRLSPGPRVPSTQHDDNQTGAT